MTRRLCIAGACLATLCCSDAADDAPAARAVAKPAPSAPAAPAAPAATTPSFVYSAIGKRDPFRSYLSEMAELAATQGPHRAREATEQFELDQYRLTGLITGTSQPKAMVEDPGGHGHVLHLGSRLGRNGGRLTQIAPNAVVVTEETRDATGKKVRLPITLKLPHTEYDDAAQR